MSIPSLPTRKIGTDDVTAIGYGAMGIAAFYGAVDSDEERLKVRDSRLRIVPEIQAHPSAVLGRSLRKRMHQLGLRKYLWRLRRALRQMARPPRTISGFQHV